MKGFQGHRKLGFFLIALLTFTLWGCKSSNQSDTSTENKISGVVTASTLTMRQDPDKSARAVSAVHRGDTVDVLEEGEAWHKVHFGHRDGYVSAKYLRILPPTETETVAQHAAETMSAEAPTNDDSTQSDVIEQYDGKSPIYNKVRSTLERLKPKAPEKAEEPMSLWAFWISFAILLIVTCVVMVLCVRLNRYYDGNYDPRDWPAWTAMLSGIAICIVGIIIGLMLPRGFLTTAIIFGMILLCGAALAVNGAWGIQRFGFDDEFKQTRRWGIYQLGRFFNNLLYAFFIVCFAFILLSIFGVKESMFRHFAESTSGAIITFIVLALIVALVYTVVYAIIDRGYAKIFYSANPAAYWVITVITYLCLLVTLNNFCTMNIAHWPTFNFILLIENLCLAVCLCIACLKATKKRRCKKCHDNNATCTRSEYSHTSTSTSYQWKNVNPRWSNQDLQSLGYQDRQKKNITGYLQKKTNTYDHYIDTYTCPRCGHEWKIKRKELIDTKTSIGLIRYTRK